MIECPKCKSKQIINQRVDSDWHNNPASQVNDDSCYTAEQIKRLDAGRIQMDIDVNICLECDTRFI